jgi:hypothetical protein
MDSAEMILSYSPDAMLDQAWQWREKAAKAADPAYGDECLQRAARYERLVRRSIETAPITDAPGPDQIRHIAA